MKMLRAAAVSMNGYLGNRPAGGEGRDRGYARPAVRSGGGTTSSGMGQV